MDALDYQMEAVLYSNSRGRRCKTLVFQRFDHACEAILHAMENLPPRALETCSIEVDEVRFFGREIRALYEAADFPLQRRDAQTA